MRSTTRPNSRWPAWCLSLLVLSPGCAELNTPFADDLPSADAVTTASVEGVRAADRRPVLRSCGVDRSYTQPQDGTVVHWPLYWEDPFVDKGSQDHRFAWTEEDYFGMVYGLGRFILNTMAFPVSAAVTPPWTLMGSDGQLSRQALGYDHDPERRPTGVAPPIDILEIGTVPEESNGLPAADETEPQMGT